MKLIRLTQGYFTKVDDEDFKYLSRFKWHVQKIHHCIYAARCGRKDDGKPTIITMHREILKPQRGMSTDHIDGDGLNNQRSNLRECSHKENLSNRRKHKGKSKYKGVSPWRDKFTASISPQAETGKHSIYLGIFDTEKEAALRYNEEATKMYGKFAHLNDVK